MKIYMIRHGVTEWNVARKLQGRADIPLNEEGRRLARETGEALAEVPFTRIYTSPLKRAYETAMLLKGTREIPVVIEERLQEISFGEFEGLCCGKEGYSIPDPAFNLFFTEPGAYVPPKDGESIAALCERTTAFLQEIVQDQQLADETILISTHGAAMMGLLSSVLHTGTEDFWHGGVHKNCAVTILEVQDGEITVVEEGKVFAR